MSLRRAAVAVAAAALTAQVGVGEGAAGRGTVWLCHPAKRSNPCLASLDTTIVHPDGSRTVVRRKPAARPAIDCFYVYPTVSAQPTPTATLAIDQAEVDIAKSQASPFSQVCRVYAPIYRQVTLYGLSHPELNPDGTNAYYDVLDAWREYLEYDNKGRGVVLIGHSQGAYELKSLIVSEIDAKPAARRLLVSAILLGADVVVANEPNAWGTFSNLRPCASRSDVGCVVAYSSWYDEPPATSRFERVTDASQRVLCVNPGAPGGGDAALLPLLRTNRPDGQLTPPVSTPWVSFPGRYVARCASSESLGWLDVDPQPGDNRPAVTESDPLWGLHGYDVSIALGNLTSLVASEAKAYAAAR